jgi:uncharacterized protein YjgD (DUF1641 family)
MARPITLTEPVRDARRELTEQLRQAPAEHAEALLEVYELLQQLHDRQILALMCGALAASDRLVESATRAADSPPAVAALRNIVILGKALGSIDPAVTRGISAALTETMSGAHQDNEPPSLLSLLGRFRSREVRRGIAFVNQFLGALGRHVGATPSEKTQLRQARVPSKG